MTNLRRNHQRKGLGFNMSKILIFAVILVGALWFCFKNIDSIFGESNSQNIESILPEDRFYLPTGSEGQIVHHSQFSLSYSEKHEQAEWVAYDLSIAELNHPKVPRAKRFNVDYNVRSNSAQHRDYSNSGYTRGHLAPAGDMSYDSLAMQESFFMSNISPQIRPFNNGIWRELEEQVRDWGRQYKKLYIVTGPILSQIEERIGKNRVAVPKEFYKIILDIEGPDKKGIAFIIPHEVSSLPLRNYAMSIDQAESKTGLNFYPDLMTDQMESEIESKADPTLWTFDEKRFKRRTNDWNNQ